MRAPDRSTRRASRAAAVVLLVLAQLGAFAHAATVRHVRCVEHGDLVEAATIARHLESGVRLVSVELGIRDDEHCSLAGALGHHAAAPARASSIATPARGAAATPISTTSRADLTALYLIAPKTSPPVRTQSR
jgi:hypothetical protein